MDFSTFYFQLQNFITSKPFKPSTTFNKLDLTNRLILVCFADFPAWFYLNFVGFFSRFSSVC